jgi:oligoendopeptidase F
MLELNLLESPNASASNNEIAGPAWDNSSEYPSLDSKELKADLEKAESMVSQIEAFAKAVKPFLENPSAISKDDAKAVVASCQDAYRNYHEAGILIWNVGTYASCEGSCDGTNAEAKSVSAKTGLVGSKLSQAYKPVDLFLTLTSDEVAKDFLNNDDTKYSAFHLSESRKKKDQALSLKEEDLIIGFGIDGKNAWGTLYDNISGTLSCDIEMPDGSKKKAGLAEAASMAMGEDRAIREAAYKASTKAWETQSEACSQVLNSLSGWRLEEYKRRSIVKPVHFLDAPLHSSRISRKTLDTMMEVTRNARHLGQKVLKLQAQSQGLAKLSPWDLNSPAPKMADSNWEKPSFDQAIDLICNAFGTVNPDMSDFVRHMVEQKWVDGTVGPNKRPGAYCTKFPKSRSPRVYMTYSGGMREVKTLAHELGHAFHNWVMKEMPIQECHYPMTLAETASIFAETVVNNALIEKADSVGDRFSFLWSTCDEITGLLINVAARYDFEKDLYTQRAEGPLNPDRLKSMMNSAWGEWYGDTLTENNQMFWASKLHFHISGLSFYNYPYIFGYLFALGVYAQKDVLGDKFYDSYVALLQDTGRMSAEEVAKKHLGVDLEKPEFWEKSIEIISKNVDRFEEVVNELK